MIENVTLEYILAFLCDSESSNILSEISYCYKDEIGDSRVVIVQSEFFDKGVYGTTKSQPKLPLKQMNGVPILYGENRVEEKNGQIIIYADIIASAYYMLSRYEEMIRPELRDMYGRFPWKESLPCRAGFIGRPIVDEYGKILRSCLRKSGVDINEPKSGFSAINLTHDVDEPWGNYSFYYGLRRCMSVLIREKRLIFYPILNSLGIVRFDPNNMFEELIKMDAELPKAKSVYFLKTGKAVSEKDSSFNIGGKNYKKIIEHLSESGAVFGLHISYYAGEHTEKIAEEKELVEAELEKNLTICRSHYLRSMEPSDFETLIEAGIKEDYTMGYAGMPGFRLGTSRPVKWINPRDGKITELILHHLTIMDCSMLDTRYMGLEVNEAADYAYKLLDNVWSASGELNLLWHNRDLKRPEWILYKLILKRVNEMLQRKEL